VQLCGFWLVVGVNADHLRQPQPQESLDCTALPGGECVNCYMAAATDKEGEQRVCGGVPRRPMVMQWSNWAPSLVSHIAVVAGDGRSDGDEVGN
jgi:hypothetical protein